jgi:type II secretory pathway predicted ATPase ExeA
MSASPVETLPQPRILFNTFVKRVQFLAEKAWKKRGIITFTSPSGTGKSTAVNYAEQKLNFPHKVLRVRQITSVYDLLRSLGLEPGERWTVHGRRWMRSSDLYHRVVAGVLTSPFLLLIDEADRLRSDCFEMLRDLWDEASLPMLLVGNEVLNHKINRQHERLFRRIKMRVDSPKLREGELREVLSFMGHDLEDEEFTLVWKALGGSPGFVDAVIGLADEIAAANGVKRDIAAVQGSLKYFPTLGGAG